MTKANFKATAKLDAAPLKKGFAELKASFATLKKDVAMPIAEASGAVADLTKKLFLASAAAAAVGVKNAFGDEKYIKRFELLGLTIEDAKKRYQELVNLGMSQKGAAIDSDTWTEAALALRKVGGEALDNDQLLVAIGNTAVKSGKRITELTAILTDFYAKLAGGKPVDEQAVMLFREGAISESGLQRITAAVKAGQESKAIWAEVVKELEANAGALEIAGSSGVSQFTRIKTVLGQSFGAVFGGFAEQFKGMLYAASEGLSQLYADGTLEVIGERIAAAVQTVIDFVGRLVAAWRELSPEAKAQIESIAVYLLAFVVLLKSGVLAPIISAVFGALKFIIPPIITALTTLGSWILKGMASILAKLGISLGVAGGVITVALLGIVGVIAGYKLGEVIADSLDPSGWVMTSLTKLMAWIENFGAKVGIVFSNLFDWDEMSAQLEQQSKQYERQSAQLEEELANAHKEWEKGGSTFAEHFAKNMAEKWEDIKKGAAGLIPDGVKEFFNNFTKIEDFKFPPMPDYNPIDQSLGTEKALNDVREMRRELAVFNLRGSYARLGRLRIDPAAMMRGAESSGANNGDVVAAINSNSAEQINISQQQLAAQIEQNRLLSQAINNGTGEAVFG